MATNGFCDICANGVPVVATFGSPQLTFATDSPITLPSFGMFTRAASGLATEFAIVKLNTGGDALLVNRAGTQVDLGPTYGNYCVGLLVGSSVRAVWQATATQYKFRLFDATLTPLGAATTVAIPQQFIGTSQGFLDLQSNGTPIWTDGRRTLTVSGIPLIYPVERGGYWLGQGGGTLGAQIVGVAPNGRPFTLYQGESFEPHLAGPTAGVLYAATRTTADGAQFFTINPNALPNFVAGDGTVVPGGAGGQPTAGAGNGFVGPVNPPPLQQPMVTDPKSGLVTRAWALWFNSVQMAANTPDNFADLAGAPPPPVGGTDPGAGPITGLSGDVVAAGPGVVPATIQPNVVDNTKFRQSVGDSVVGRAANTTGNVADIVAGADSTLFGRRSGALTFAKADLAAEVTGRLPYANLTAALAASHLLGRTSASAGDWQDISLSSDLAMALTVLGLAADRLLWRFHTATFTDAQIKGWPTASIRPVVAAPGGGFRIVLVQATVATVLAAPYTNIDAAGYAVLALDTNEIGNYIGNDAGVTPALADYTNLFTNAVSYANMVPFSQTVDPATAEWGNAALVKSINFDNLALNFLVNNGGSGDFTGGDPANTLTINAYTLVEAV